MRPLRIEGCTRRLGAPEGWDHGAEGICHTLEILDHDGFMVSAWAPSPEELKRINEGKPLLLWINGVAHPVVQITVGK